MLQITATDRIKKSIQSNLSGVSRLNCPPGESGTATDWPLHPRNEADGNKGGEYCRWEISRAVSEKTTSYSGCFARPSLFRDSERRVFLTVLFAVRRAHTGLCYFLAKLSFLLPFWPSFLLVRSFLVCLPLPSPRFRPC
jgi:hypothetical protein